MKKHLMIMTAMLSFGITHNCQSSDKPKNNYEACEEAFQCKSNVCKDNKCQEGKQKVGVRVMFRQECESQQMSCVTHRETIYDNAGERVNTDRLSSDCAELYKNYNDLTISELKAGARDDWLTRMVQRGAMYCWDYNMPIKIQAPCN